MHKKIEADLISLAHRILKMKGKSDILTLKRVSQEVYEKLSLLAFIEEYVNHTPGIKATKEELLEKVETGLHLKSASEKELSKSDIEASESPNQDDTKVLTSEIAQEIKSEEPKKEPIPEIVEQPFDELESLMFEQTTTSEVSDKNTESIEHPKEEPPKKMNSLDDELQDTISVDVMADLFENAQPKSLNDKLASTIQIGLNDRIAFVKHLFHGEQEDYNRVISQLNTFKTEKEALDFVNTMVKPDYNWAAHEDLEVRFLEIVSRKFA
jgi:hypothetical protein